LLRLLDFPRAILVKLKWAIDACMICKLVKVFEYGTFFFILKVKALTQYYCETEIEYRLLIKLENRHLNRGTENDCSTITRLPDQLGALLR
jgi:hypothetical protein